MGLLCTVAFCILTLQAVLAVDMTVVMQSQQTDSKVEDEDSLHIEPMLSTRAKINRTMLPFIKNTFKQAKERVGDETYTTENSLSAIHPNDVIFSVIYNQKHINSMFKYDDHWYTWTIEKHTDGSTTVNYYICNDEPNTCHKKGWDRIETVPKCAFQIEALLPDDRACIYHFGVESENSNNCDDAELMKVKDIVQTCGSLIRSLWKFERVEKKHENVANKLADVNSLLCKDAENCYVTVEYRIHHDRITFSLHEPSKCQTFKSILKREFISEGENNETKSRANHRNNKNLNEKHSKKYGRTKSKMYNVSIHTKRPNQHSNQIVKEDKVSDESIFLSLE